MTEVDVLTPDVLQGLGLGHNGGANFHLDPKIKTAMRMKYEAEAKAITNRLGDLEEIRLKLGLSQRKICQLLMVDPSAWSRWTKNPSKNSAPPMVYRALAWYLALEDKYPALDVNFWLNTVARTGSGSTNSMPDRTQNSTQDPTAGRAVDPLPEKIRKLEAEVARLRSFNQKATRLGLVVGILIATSLIAASVVMAKFFAAK